jgi:hypothetical protein
LHFLFLHSKENSSILSIYCANQLAIKSPATLLPGSVYHVWFARRTFSSIISYYYIKYRSGRVDSIRIFVPSGAGRRPRVFLCFFRSMQSIARCYPSPRHPALFIMCPRRGKNEEKESSGSF